MSYVPEHGLTHGMRGCDSRGDCDSPRGAACRLRTGREAILVAVGRLSQGVAMIAVGVFLLSRIAAAPQLAVQVSILGALLVAGGCAFTTTAVATMTSHVTVDRDGIRGRLGHAAFNIAWADVAKWRVSDHDDRLSPLACAEVWMEGMPSSRSLPGGFLDRETRRRLRESCRSIAPEREQR